MKIIFTFFKKLFKIVLTLFLILLVLAIILYLTAGKIVQKFAPEFISQVTQTETALGEVDLSLLSGRVALNNLAIGNPAGFKDKNVFEVGKVLVNFDPQSVLTNKIVINNVQIDGVNISVELNSQGKTNITELLANVNKFIGSDATSNESNQPTPQQKQNIETTSSKTVVIRDLIIDNSSVRTGVAGQMVTIPLAQIHQQNIGENKKETITGVLVTILNTINAESTKAVVKATKETLEKNIQSGKGAIDSLKDTFKGLF